MSQPQLDLSTDNLLGKGKLPARLEQDMLQQGIVYATWIQPKNPNDPPFLFSCYEPVAEFATRAYARLFDVPLPAFVPAANAITETA